jgi:putative Holliday junction resolvase
MGLDFGEKTIGVAVSGPGGRTAVGMTTLHRNMPEALRHNIRELKAITRERDIRAIVLGYPKHMDNNPSERCAVTLAFKEKLARTIKNIPIVLWDERLSTQAVVRAFDGSFARYEKAVDEMAAVYILQGYLDYIDKKSREAPMDNENILSMYDDEGNETQYEVLATQKDEDTVYWLLAEMTEDGEEAEVFHCKCVITDGEEMDIIFIDEEDGDFEKVFNLFKEDYEELGIEID